MLFVIDLCVILWNWNSVWPGDPTEVAMVVATYKAGLNKQTWLDKGYDLCRNAVNKDPSLRCLFRRWEFVNESPFDSERKRMTVVYSFGGNNCM